MKALDIKQLNKTAKVICNRRHPQITTWEEMLAEVKKI